MSTGPVITLDQAETIGRLLKAAIHPTGTLYRAGSFRRGEATMRDVDLVCVIEGQKGPFIDRLTRTGNRWTCINEDITTQTKAFKLRWRGHPIGEDQVPAGAHVDVYTCRPDAFGWIHMVRTGPADFGKELVTIVKAWGFEFTDGRLCKMVEGGDLIHKTLTPEILPTPTERSVFEALGLEYLDLPHRTVAWLRHVASRRTPQ